MALIEPTYNKQEYSYRLPNSFEGNGISKYDFLISILNKGFIYKRGETKNLATIDFLSVDNIFLVDKILTTI